MSGQSRGRRQGEDEYEEGFETARVAQKSTSTQSGEEGSTEKEKVCRVEAVKKDAVQTPKSQQKSDKPGNNSQKNQAPLKQNHCLIHETQSRLEGLQDQERNHLQVV